MVSPTTAQHGLHDLRDRIELLINDGPALGIECAIIACLDGAVLLRPGASTRRARPCSKKRPPLFPLGVRSACDRPLR
jgi:tRNA A37 threonylcarbamoyladenosine synthetase subunit TsaC/SUA5/YrdC